MKGFVLFAVIIGLLALFAAPMLSVAADIFPVEKADINSGAFVVDGAEQLFDVATRDIAKPVAPVVRSTTTATRTTTSQANCANGQCTTSTTSTSHAACSNGNCGGGRRFLFRGVERRQSRRAARQGCG